MLQPIGLDMRLVSGTETVTVRESREIVGKARGRKGLTLRLRGGKLPVVAMLGTGLWGQDRCWYSWWIEIKYKEYILD